MVYYAADGSFPKISHTGWRLDILQKSNIFVTVGVTNDLRIDASYRSYIFMALKVFVLYKKSDPQNTILNN